MQYMDWSNKKVSVIYHTRQIEQGVVSYINDKMIILNDNIMIPMSNVAMVKKIKENTDVFDNVNNALGKDKKRE